MTDLTTALAEALRLISFASMDRGARDTATEALRLYDEATAQPVQDLPPLPDAHWVEEFSHGTLVYTADQMHAYARAALAATPATTPQGWKLVPVEPTKEMVEAAYDNVTGGGGRAAIYAAMLAAAPEAATPAPARCANGPMGCDYPRCDCNGASTKESNQ